MNMKKLLSLVLVLCICSFTACTAAVTEHEIISQELGIDVAKGQMQVYTDDHGGFHGDGETYAEIRFSDDDFLRSIQNHPEWSPLPFTPNLQIVVYGGTLPSGDSWSSFIKDEADQPRIPTLSNGYFFFRDRQSRGQNQNDDARIFDRLSMNFTLAIYDTDTRTLYFYALDT